MTWTQRTKLSLRGALVAGALVLPTAKAFAHCDTLDGPVVTEAKKALETGKVALVLPWVAKDDEDEIRRVFDHVQKVRKLGGEAATLADRFFFETLVRIHRASEGEPFTGLKPGGLDLGPVIPAANRALQTGSAAALIKLVVGEAEEGLRKRFSEARERKRRAGESVEAGREFVRAYVEFMHYAERLFQTAGSSAAHHGEGEAGQAPAHAH